MKKDSTTFQWLHDDDEIENIAAAATAADLHFARGLAIEAAHN